MKIGFITTIDTNIGDDFIRTGIENILDSIIGKDNIQYTYINKHKPETAILPNSLLGRLYRIGKFKGKDRIIKWLEKNYTHLNSVYKDQDLIIQSGAPVLWIHCEQNEWAIPLWYRTVGKLKDKIPVLNLAAGSCYPWENQGNFHNKEEAVYAKDIGSFCRLTTTRDKLANKLFSSVGINNTLLPCTAFFVNADFENTNEKRYILINYMEGAGHFDWGQDINKADWEESVKYLIQNLKKEHEICFICHSEHEVELSKSLAPDLKTFYPRTVKEYLDCIKYAKLGINNRMHASVAMSSFGAPTISVCTDTRLLMLENIGATYYYVKDINKEQLLQKSLELLQTSEVEAHRLFALKKQKFNDYGYIIKENIG